MSIDNYTQIDYNIIKIANELIKQAKENQPTMKRTKQLLKLSNAAAIKGKALQRKLVNLLDTMQYEAADAVNANGIIAWDLCFKATRHTAIDFLERSKTK